MQSNHNSNAYQNLLSWNNSNLFHAFTLQNIYIKPTLHCIILYFNHILILFIDYDRWDGLLESCMVAGVVRGRCHRV